LHRPEAQAEALAPHSGASSSACTAGRRKRFRLRRWAARWAAQALPLAPHSGLDG